MQTSVQHTANDNDLFAEPAMLFEGILAADAELRTKVIGSMHIACPVICFELKNVGSGGMNIHAEQVYTEQTRRLAEQLLPTYKRGTRIAITSAMTDMRLVLPHVQSVTVQPN